MKACLTLLHNRAIVWVREVSQMEIKVTWKLTAEELKLLKIAKDQLGLEWTGKINTRNEYIMYTQDGGREPFSRKALIQSLSHG